MSLVSFESAPGDAGSRVVDGLPLSLVVVDMVWPDQSNHHGTLFGGAALSMLASSGPTAEDLVGQSGPLGAKSRPIG